jgi:hypothetical protein
MSNDKKEYSKQENACTTWQEKIQRVLKEKERETLLLLLDVVAGRSISPPTTRHKHSFVQSILLVPFDGEQHATA